MGTSPTPIHTIYQRISHIHSIRTILLPYKYYTELANPKDFFDNSVMMTISGDNIITQVSAGDTLLACYNWSLNISFDNQQLNIMTVSLDEYNEPCYGDVDF